MSDDLRLDDTLQTDSPSEKASNLPEDFVNLSGKTQDRIRQLVEIKNKALEEKQAMEAELQRLRSQSSTPSPAPATHSVDPTDEERKALERMRSLGVLTREELDAERERIRSEMQAKEDRRLLDSAHERLESKYAGGEYPAYDRKEVEDFMKSRGVYDPEIAYEQLYRDEVIKIEANKLNKRPQTPHSERTRSRIGDAEPWTKERIQERMRQPDGKDWYMKNMEKVDRILADM